MSTGLLLGTHFPRLDEKGRLILPAKYRGRLAEGLVVTKGQERCLFLYPLDEFAQIARAVQTGPLASRQQRDLARMLLSGASEEKPDQQGRVTIPQLLREYAGLDRDLAVLGAGNRCEIWDATSWATYSQGAEFTSTYEEVPVDMP